MKKTLNIKALEKEYNLGLKLEKEKKFIQAAEAYKRALEIDPDDHAGLYVRLASIKEGPTPERASKAYVSTLFDQVAEAFDYILVNQLKYNVPFQIRKIFDHYFSEQNFENMLDLGCGTGLCAEAFEDICLTKVGVDISEKMIEIADEKGDYTYLYIADILEFITKKNDIYDIIIAADVLPYIGELSAFIKNIKKNLSTKGVFCFSTETLEEKGNYKVGPYQRFSHSADYIKEILSLQKISIIHCENVTVRFEQGAPVLGQIYICQNR